MLYLGCFILAGSVKVQLSQSKSDKMKVLTHQFHHCVALGNKNENALKFRHVIKEFYDLARGGVGNEASMLFDTLSLKIDIKLLTYAFLGDTSTNVKIDAIICVICKRSIPCDLYDSLASFIIFICRVSKAHII